MVANRPMAWLGVWVRPKGSSATATTNARPSATARAAEGRRLAPGVLAFQTAVVHQPPVRFQK
jgi:hypothetical protein